MKTSNLVSFLSIFFISLTTFCQNTVGTITNNTRSYNGYTLFAPLTSNETYLINNCGEVIQQWTSAYRPGASVYLLENGNLLRTGRIPNPTINFGGVGGKIELFDWDGNLLWEYSHSSPTFVQHHDIYPLPNGNILMLSAEVIPGFEAIQSGRNPALLDEGSVYNEQILELQPVGTNQANIVWEWNIKDHLIQDFDNSKDNFGNVRDNPQLLDFNYLNSSSAAANWLHINSIQYSENLDQIILSSRHISELYIIDHSTTTAEAASNSGGTYGKGGDFLYRWGNPEAYRLGTSVNRQLFGQHYPHTIKSGLEDEGKILIFNNSNSTENYNFSSVDIINPPQTTNGVYDYDEVNGFGPSEPEWRYIAPEPSSFNSPILSSAQRLPNGNTLICAGNSGYFFEITPTNEIVWEYVNPDTSNGILSQNDTPSQNNVFRALKFSYDYPAFIGRDLTPGNPIELNPDLSNCTLLNTVDHSKVLETILYPNPTTGKVLIKTNSRIDKIEIYDTLGKLIASESRTDYFNFESMKDGLYIMRIFSNNKVVNKKIIKN